MVQAGQVVRTAASTLEYLATRHETGGARHEMRVTYDPGAPFPPAHLHPNQTEEFTVEEGELVFSVDGDERRLPAGSSITLPAGTVHTIRNPDGERRAVARWVTRPALRTGELFEELAAAAGDGAQMLQVLAGHAEEIQLAVDQPSS